MAKWETVTDDFPGTTLAANWNPYGTRSVSGNKLHFPAVSNNAGATDYGNDLTASFVMARVEAPTSGYSELAIYEGGVYRARIQQNGANIAFRVGATTLSTIAYSATDHAWWRIREAAGTTYLETSPSGLAGSWVERASAANAGALTNCDCDLAGGGGSTGSGEALFSKFNLVPVGGTNSYSEPLADTASTSTASTDAAGGTEPLDDTAASTAANTDVASGTDSLDDAASVTAIVTDAHSFAESPVDAASASAGLVDAHGATESLAEPLAASEGLVDALAVSDQLDDAVTSTDASTDSAGAVAYEDFPSAVIESFITLNDAAGFADPLGDEAFCLAELLSTAASYVSVLETFIGADLVSDAMAGIDTVEDLLVAVDTASDRASFDIVLPDSAIVVVKASSYDIAVLKLASYDIEEKT